MLRDLAVLTALQNRKGNEFQVRQRIRQWFYSETSQFRFIKTRPVGNQQGKPARLLRCENCLDTGTEAWHASEVNQPIQTQQGRSEVPATYALRPDFGCVRLPSIRNTG